MANGERYESEHPFGAQPVLIRNQLMKTHVHALAALLLIVGPAFAGIHASEPRVVRTLVTADDFRGVLYKFSEEEYVQIEDLVFGVNDKDRLIIAYWQYVEPGGRVVTKDTRASA